MKFKFNIGRTRIHVSKSITIVQPTTWRGFRMLHVGLGRGTPVFGIVRTGRSFIVNAWPVSYASSK